MEEELPNAVSLDPKRPFQDFLQGSDKIKGSLSARANFILIHLKARRKIPQRHLTAGQPRVAHPLFVDHRGCDI